MGKDLLFIYMNPRFKISVAEGIEEL